MVTHPQDSTCLPLQEKIVHNNKTDRAIELVILSLLFSLLIYRVVMLKDQDHYLPWLLAFLCESWFTFYWTIGMFITWNQCNTVTYPERLLKRVSETEFPAVDIFVTTADPILEPCIITMNTVLSLLAVDYPAENLTLYLSDDGCSPLTYYSLVETTKFAKLWVPFCKKYNVQVRAPFRYFTPTSKPLEDDSLEFQQEWKRMKVISENSEGNPNDLPHVIYISREKSPKHHHHYKAGAMNVLTRVSGVMTNAPLMLNVDCDMYANNPQVFLHAMCILFGFENEQDCGFVQFPQAFYNGLTDDPFGNQLVNLTYILNGIAALQGCFYGGSNCFHRRKVIYGSYPNDTIETKNIGNGNLHKILGKSVELRESAAQILTGSNEKIQNRRSPSSFIEAAMPIASCNYEHGTSWGKKVGWLYGSATEDILTGISIHGRGWKSVFCSPEPLAFLGCAPNTYPSSLTQQKRWATGVFEVFFTNKNPLLLTIKGKIWFRQTLAYLWLCLWGPRSVPELCYATLPAYCIITNSHFLPKINEPAFLIPMGIFVIYNVYSLWQVKRLGVSYRMWWNLQKMGRVNTMTAWLFGFLSVMLKLIGLSNTVFEVTKKEQSSNDGDDDANSGRFTYDKSPIIIPGVAILLINLTALVNGMSRLVNVDFSENWIGVLGLGEIFCCVWVSLCFSEFLKGLFANGKYRIPSSTIWKSGAFALFFVHLCRKSSQLL